MIKRTWCYTLVTALLISGLAACGGSGGGGGGGGGVPSATNSAITPPPATPVSIATTAGPATSTTNQTIAAKSAQAASDGAVSDAGTVSGLVGSVTGKSGTQAQRETLGEIVRRHAEKLKDHQASVNDGSATSTLQVQTQPCSNGGTMTVAFDDANQSATEVFVQCNQGGEVTHGTFSSSNVSVIQNLGPTAGSPYSISVTATFTIDLSITTTSPASTNVTQGSFTFTASFSGNMQATANGGVQPGAPNHIQLSMSGSSILIADGNVRERLSDFNLSVDDNDTTGKTTISGGYTYASTLIGGSVTVSITQPIVEPQGGGNPTSGQITITSSGSPGKIVLTVISTPVVGVRVDVFANQADLVATNSSNLTWAQVDQL